MKEDHRSIEPEVWKLGRDKTKKDNEHFGSEVNMALKGKPCIQVNLSRAQYSLMLSALAGTIKGSAAGTAKLLAIDMNRQLIASQDGETATLRRINYNIEENLEPELRDKLKDIASSVH